MSQPRDALAKRERAFTSLYEAVYPDLVRFAQRRTHHDHAEDVAAEAFMVVWRRLDELPPARDDARAWIFGIARHILLNVRRGDRRRQSLCVTDDSAGLFTGGMIGSIGTPADYTTPGPQEVIATSLGTGTVNNADISLAAGTAGPDVVEIVYPSPNHGDVAATVSHGSFALWLPGDELEGASSTGVDVEVTYHDGTSGTARLTL